jgi:hypothetical protein
MAEQSRQATSVELPPQPPINLQQWAEDIIDYLTRMNQEKQRQIDDLQERVTALEAFHP